MQLINIYRTCRRLNCFSVKLQLHMNNLVIVSQLQFHKIIFLLMICLGLFWMN